MSTVRQFDIREWIKTFTGKMTTKSVKEIRNFPWSWNKENSKAPVRISEPQPQFFVDFL